MEKIIDFLNSIDLNLDFNFNFDVYTIGITALVLFLGTILLSSIGRFAFGKRSILNNAVSSAIGIIFIYTLTVVLHSAGAQYQRYITPLPFVSFSANSLQLFSFSKAHYTVICGEILSMIILSFLVNIADSWLPKGKNLFTWLFFRCLTVIAGFVLHFIAVGLLATYLPEGIIIYAPTILLALLALLLLTGVLKIIVGAFLTTVNPIIGGLYTFFFATFIGKQITKAVLTTGVLAAIVFALCYFGITAISLASAALLGYIPLLILLIVLWYIVYKFF